MIYRRDLPMNPDEIAAIITGAAPAIGLKHCKDCVFWNGKDTQDMGDCLNENVYQPRTPFNYTCEEWVQKRK